VTDRPDLARLAANLLASPAAGKRAVSASQEARAIALVAGAIRSRKERMRRRRWAYGAVAAAAGVALVFGVAKRRALLEGTPFLPPDPVATVPAAAPADAVVEAVIGDAYVMHGDQGRSVVKGSPIAAGDRLVVQPRGHVAFLLPTGSRVAIDEGSDLSVVASTPTQLFRLGAGSMQADVNKLGPAERFVVLTRDGEIEVRGTSFRLSNAPSDPSCGEGTTTRLSVYKGVVEVRIGSAATSVSAGESWPSGCASRSASEISSGPPAAPLPTPASRPAPEASPLDTARSQLADQNDMYARALAARERGDSAGAIAAFDRLVAKYPSSPLAENAFAERMKILARITHRRAADAAREYLARYPSGFARDDAETILRSGASDR
jgi:hypothetical protein